jgi:hypothetical protein
MTVVAETGFGICIGFFSLKGCHISALQAEEAMQERSRAAEPLAGRVRVRPQAAGVA